MGALIIITWTGTCCAVMFGTMKALNVLRVRTEVEIAGLDRIKHGEPAYPVGGYNDGEHPLNNAAKGNPCRRGLFKPQRWEICPVERR